MRERKVRLTLCRNGQGRDNHIQLTGPQRHKLVAERAPDPLGLSQLALLLQVCLDTFPELNGKTTLAANIVVGNKRWGLAYAYGDIGFWRGLRACGLDRK
jgi:hypothetical protein